MGTVYTHDIKRIAQEIYERFKDQVTLDFTKNKELVNKVLEIKSKKVRNRVAGYLTRIAKLSKVQKSQGEIQEEVQQ
jgi:small subunit ribosomal protein S17e